MVQLMERVLLIDELNIYQFQFRYGAIDGSSTPVYFLRRYVSIPLWCN